MMSKNLRFEDLTPGWVKAGEGSFHAALFAFGGKLVEVLDSAGKFDDEDDARGAGEVELWERVVQARPDWFESEASPRVTRGDPS